MPAEVTESGTGLGIADFELDGTNLYIVESKRELVEAWLTVGLMYTGSVTLRIPTGIQLADGTLQQRVRGWSLAAGTYQEQDQQAAFASWCTDHETGDPLPPEYGVLYGPPS